MRQDNGLESAAAFYQNSLFGLLFLGGMGDPVEGVLIELFVVVQAFGLVEKRRLAGDDNEGRVFLDAVPGRAYLKQADVVVPVIILVGYGQAGKLEQVDASSVAFRNVCAQVNAREGCHVIVVFVHAVIGGAVFENRSQTGDNVYIFLGERLGEEERQVAGAVANGNTLGNELFTVGDGAVNAGFRSSQRLRKFRDVDVLDKVCLVVAGTGDGVGCKEQLEAEGLRVAAQIQRIQGRNQGEGAFPGGESEDIVPDGADGHVAVGIARQVAGQLHLNLVQVELHCICIEQKGLVNKVFAQAVIGVYAAGGQKGRGGKT